MIRKFLKKHQKKFVAFVMMLLMVTFAASSGNRTPNHKTDIVMGHVGKTTIFNLETQQAHAEWGVLNRDVVRQTYNPYTGQPITYPIAEDLFPQEVFRSDKAADLFMLLRHEARESGVKANSDEIETLMTNNYHRPEGSDDSVDDIAREAINDYLLIQANFNRIAGDVKISQPQRDRYLAQSAQQIQLDVVELSGSDFATKVAAPTTQQVQEQFTAYVDTAPGHPDENNPFGFGYRLADAVKLQYLAVYREEAQKTVEASKSPYDWEVEARLYYRRHPEEFAATQPTTQALGPTLPPTTQPYSEVAQKVMAAVLKPQVDKLMFDVQGKILSTMQADWRAYTQSGSGSYPSYTYLNDLVNKIKAQFQITVYATDMDRDFLSEADLGALPTISHATNGRMEFAQYAMEMAAPYLARSDKGTPAALGQLLQPSVPITDPSVGNVYIFRLTNARSAQPAPGVAEVSVKIDNDLRNQAAYELAKQAGNQLLAAAARSNSLATTAAAIGKGVWTTSSFANSFGEGPAYLGTEITLSESGEKDFVEQAFSMLANYQPDENPHPVRLIEIPQDGKVYVARLTKLSPGWNSSNFFALTVLSSARLQTQEMLKLRNDWMDYDAVVQRLDYKPENSSKDSSS